MSKQTIRYSLGILLLFVGFFLGVAWKNKDYQGQESTSNNQDELQEEDDNRKRSENTTEIAPRGALTSAEKATIKLFEEAAPSVCYITTTNLRVDYYTRNLKEIPRGSGSGFVWDKKGHIVTNFHVIQKADKAEITLADQTTWTAKLVGIEPRKDLAILKIEAPANKLRPIPVGTSGDLKVGQSVYAIGNPFGLDQTLTTGVVSALGREIESVAKIPIRDVIQTDAAINPGNSGGPLLDSAGRLIGVNTAIFSPSGASAGIGFSIPVDVVSWVVPELIKYGELRRPSLGIEVAPQYVLRNTDIEGLLIVGVVKGGPADKAGIKPTTRAELGDIILSINDEKIGSYNDLVLTLEKYQPGDKVSVELLRNKRKRTVELTLSQIQG